MLPEESFLKTLRARVCCGSALGCAGGRAANDRLARLACFLAGSSRPDSGAVGIRQHDT
jgi:hypothetical protein